MVSALVLSTVVIFVAELGDKSQLMALAFATRYRTWVVLTGITVATALVHAFSVAIGAAAGAVLPTQAIQVAAALAFFGFAWWTWRGDELTDEDRERADRGGRSAVLAVGTAFFLAELGDKTMLATITLATDNDAWWGCGSAARSAWSPPTPSPCSSGGSWAPGCRSERSGSGPRSRSRCSGCCCSSRP